MTWAEFCASAFNVDTHGLGHSDFYIVNSNCIYWYTPYDFPYILYYNGVMVRETDLIQSGATYYGSMGSGGAA